MESIERSRCTPVYRQVAGIIRDRIGTRYRAGEYIPSERELSLEFAIDRSTVRKALDLLICDGLLERKPGAGYLVKGTMPAVARSYEGLDLVALVIPNSPGFYLFAPLMRACERELYQNSFHLITCVSNDDLAAEVQHLHLLAERRIRGVLLWSADPSTNSPVIRQTCDSGVPLVLLDRFAPEVPTDFVGLNNTLGARAATEHLIGLGHRRITLLASRESVTSTRERASGYEDALRAHGLTPAKAYLESSDTQEAVHECVHRLLTHPQPPTAILAGNDLIAYAVLAALEAEGRLVPDDISLVGFDDVEEAPQPRVPLTSVRQPFAEIGRTATQLLLKRIREGTNGPVQHVCLEPTLIVRGTSGGPRSQEAQEADRAAKVPVSEGITQ